MVTVTDPSGSSVVSNSAKIPKLSEALGESILLPSEPSAESATKSPPPVLVSSILYFTNVLAEVTSRVNVI